MSGETMTAERVRELLRPMTSEYPSPWVYHDYGVRPYPDEIADAGGDVFLEATIVEPVGLFIAASPDIARWALARDEAARKAESSIDGALEILAGPGRDYNKDPLTDLVEQASNVTRQLGEEIDRLTEAHAATEKAEAECDEARTEADRLRARVKELEEHTEDLYLEAKVAGEYQ